MTIEIYPCNILRAVSDAPGAVTGPLDDARSLPDNYWTAWTCRDLHFLSYGK